MGRNPPVGCWDGYGLVELSSWCGGGFSDYRRYTDKLLYPVRLPGTHNGYSAQWQNAYGILNEGVEVMVKWDITQEREVKWDMTFNIALKLEQVEKESGWERFFV